MSMNDMLIKQTVKSTKKSLKINTLMTKNHYLRKKIFTVT